jgi:quinol monooxygenase YgiN
MICQTKKLTVREYLPQETEMNDTMQHRHAIMTPKSDKIVEVRDLLIKCEEQISLKRAEGGPISWCASFDEATNRFFVDSVFADEEALAFHQNNIGPILKGVPALLAAPLETILQPVVAVAQ